MAGSEEEFSRGLVQLGWYNYPPTISDARYSGRAGAGLEPKLRAAGKVQLTEAAVYRLALNSDRWQDARSVVESHLSRDPHFAVVFCRLPKALLVFVPGNPDLAFRRARSGIEVDMLYLDLLFPSNFEIEAIKKLQDAPGQQFRSRLQEIVDTERVTREFYRQFDRELKEFQPLITCIHENDRSWYSSVMLSRLMFIYFLQRRGFLDDHRDYLRDRLLKVQALRGKDRFQSFYRFFLLRLFHEGLGSRKRPKDPILAGLLGKVPFLNGGLFDVHDVEDRNRDENGNIQIDIPDKAFENIFAFLGRWEWCLDTRPGRTAIEINPDVLGYIFEKYINATQPGEQKAKGAYYTKEDITEYIGRSTIVPRLLDRVRGLCRDKAAFESIWDLLKANPNRYIFEPVRRGVINPDGSTLPESKLYDFVQEGMHDPKKRMFKKEYNLGDAVLLDEDGKKLTLPTETWREYVARRQRCLELRDKLARGEVKDVNDLTTFNLDIRRFAKDVVAQADATLLRAFWDSMMGYEGEVGVHKDPVPALSVLDPTCGSGAFLFAVLGILEPLYSACIVRMRKLVAEAPLAKKGHVKYFRRVLALADDTERHPNPDYFILKRIVVRNLYGVDIMDEAVEICKLRLFLKLVSCVWPDKNKPNLGLEPLPDIDFNVICGNTLVGFVSKEGIRRAVTTDAAGQTKLALSRSQEKELLAIEERADEIDQLEEAFRREQWEGAVVTAGDKRPVRNKRRALSAKLDRLCASGHGKNARDTHDFDTWLRKAKPFHWFMEFRGIMKSGGFDVIIGNPPYVEYGQVRAEYTVSGYITDSCANLYAFVVERMLGCLAKAARMGMVIPISAFSNRSMGTLQDVVKGCGGLHVSSFHQRPAQLFEGVLQRLSIFLLQNTRRVLGESVMTTAVYRWYNEARAHLFPLVRYSPTPQSGWRNLVKTGDSMEQSILAKFLRQPEITRHLDKARRSNVISYRTAGGGYWWTFLCSGFKTQSLSNKQATFVRECEASVFMAALSSTLFWWYYFVNYDLFNLKDYMVFSFRFAYPAEPEAAQLSRLSRKLEDCYLANAVRYEIVSKTRGTHHTLKYQNGKCKHVIDEIDQVLAKHYGFTDEELDFIINYDIKYRMGRGAGD